MSARHFLAWAHGAYKGWNKTYLVDPVIFDSLVRNRMNDLMKVEQLSLDWLPKEVQDKAMKELGASDMQKAIFGSRSDKDVLSEIWDKNNGKADA